MNLPKEFGYYVTSGIVRKCSADRQRAEFLLNESALSFEGLRERIEKMGIDEKNANSIIKDCYDILMEMMRAKLLIDGYNASGLYAHEAEVSYMQEMGFSDGEVSFLNELRYFRNSVTYYGKILDEEYAKKVLEFLNKIYPKLKRMVK